MKKIIFNVLGLLLFGGVIYTGYFLYEKNQEPEMVFETIQIEKGNIVKKTVANGTVVPRKEIEVKPQISGIIESILVEAGDHVEVGDLIAKIKVIPNIMSLNNAENRLSVARISYDSSDRDFKRNKKLVENEVISYAEFQKFEANFLKAQEELSRAKANLQIVKDGSSKKMGKVSNTLIKATTAGMVLDIPVKEGNQVIESNNFNDGSTIAVIADMQDLIFQGKIDEAEVGKLDYGMPLLIRIGALPGDTFTAELNYISPKGKVENGAIQFEIKANLKSSDDIFIRAGYSANADIVLDQRKNIWLLNESVLQFDKDKKSFVEVEVDSQIFEKKYIELGLSDAQNVEIISGLSEKDKIKKQ